jgi:hypothetical protein
MRRQLVVVLGTLLVALVLLAILLRLLAMPLVLDWEIGRAHV